MGRLRKWKLNESYFDTIDTPEKAYCLGLLYADGCNNVEGNQITLALKPSDRDILERMRVIVGSEAPISENATRAALVLNSRHMCRALERHGCMQAKTTLIRFPFWLNESLWSHFVRGYFDGDGGLSREKSKRCRHVKYRANIVSNHAFIAELNGALSTVFGRTFPVQRYKKHRVTSQIRIEGNRQVEAFLSWIYQDATISLKRKRDLFEQLLRRPYYDLRPVYVYRKEDWSFVGKFRSRVEAANALDLASDVIVRCCQHPTWSAGGFRFRNEPLETADAA